LQPSRVSVSSIARCSSAAQQAASQEAGIQGACSQGTRGEQLRRARPGSGGRTRQLPVLLAALLQNLDEQLLLVGRARDAGQAHAAHEVYLAPEVPPLALRAGGYANGAV
jgi:hypothetical protein